MYDFEHVYQKSFNKRLFLYLKSYILRLCRMICCDKGFVMKGKKFLSFLMFLVLILILAGLYLGMKYYFGSRPVVTYTAPPPSVVVEKPERRDICSYIELSGYVESDSLVPVVPFVQGTILEYYVEAGDKVEKDQVFALVDPQAYELQQSQAEAQYLALESAFSRMEKLKLSGAVTTQDYETVKAQRDAAKAQLDLAELQLSYSSVKAPVSGTVLQSFGTTGSLASSSQPLAVIADLDNLVVKVNVPEKYYSIIKNNMDLLEFEVSNPDDGKSVSASLVSISPYIDPASKTFSLKIKLDDCNADFAVGMYVKIRIVYEKLSSVLSLSEGIKKLDGSLYIYDSQTSTAKNITLTELGSDGSYFAVDEEYAETMFVVDGQDSVFDGQLVAVVEAVK